MSTEDTIRQWDEWAAKALPTKWHWNDQEREWECDEHDDIDCTVCPLRSAGAEVQRAPEIVPAEPAPDPILPLRATSAT